MHFLRLFLNALKLTGPPPAAGPPVVGGGGGGRLLLFLSFDDRQHAVSSRDKMTFAASPMWTLEPVQATWCLALLRGSLQMASIVDSEPFLSRFSTWVDTQPNKVRESDRFPALLSQAHTHAHPHAATASLHLSQRKRRRGGRADVRRAQREIGRVGARAPLHRQAERVRVGFGARIISVSLSLTRRRRFTRATRPPRDVTSSCARNPPPPPAAAGYPPPPPRPPRSAGLQRGERALLVYPPGQ